MKKVGIGIDYSNICKDYNTMYLDRDNTDRETGACMKKVMAWISDFLAELQESFEYKIYRINNESVLDIDEIARKRFLFYSLEKEMLSQTFILENGHVHYDTFSDWAADEKDNVLLQNDDEGEGLFFYFNEGSKVESWILEKLQDFSLEKVSFGDK